MKHVVVASLLLLLLTLTVVAALAQVSPHFDLSWNLFSGGGGSRQSENVQIDDVLGQWADGRSRSDRYRLDPGFWYSGSPSPAQNQFVPVVFNPGT